MPTSQTPSPFLVALALGGWMASLAFFFPKSLIATALTLMYVLLFSFALYKRRRALPEQMTGDGIIRSLAISLIIPVCLWFFKAVQLDILGIFFLPALGGLFYNLKQKQAPAWPKILLGTGSLAIIFFLVFPDGIFYNPIVPQRTLAFFIMLASAGIYAWHKHSQELAAHSASAPVEQIFSNLFVLWFVFLIQSPLALTFSSSVVSSGVGILSLLFLAHMFVKRSAVQNQTTEALRRTNILQELIPLILSLGLWFFSGDQPKLVLILSAALLVLYAAAFALWQTKSSDLAK